MPRLDDPSVKIKERKTFSRPGLRPWDEPELFKPTQIPVQKTGLIGKQKVNNRETIGKQKVNNRETIGKQKVNNRETIGIPISKQLVNENSPYQVVLEAISCLYGLEKKLVLYVVKNCKERGQLCTKKITNKEIRILLNTDKNTVKTITQRVIKKGLLKRKTAKKGKGGFTVFETTENIRNSVIEIHEEELIGIPIGKQLVNEKVNNSPYSSSSYINTTTKTSLDNKGGQDTESLSNQPPSVNISPLTSIGLTHSHVLQLTTNNKLTVEQIQDSINFFAFDLTHNDKARALKKTPLDFFMGILRQGHPYAAPANYESPEAQSLRLYLESKQRLSQLTAELETKVKAELFQEWQASLTAQELEAFYVENSALDGLSENLRGSLRRRHALDNARQYFSTQIWPEKRQRILEEKLNLAEKCPDGD